MARYDVYRSRDGKQLLLDCQSEWLDHFQTRIVVPLVSSLPVKEIDRLHPSFEILGERRIMATQLASAVSMSELGDKVANIAKHGFVIMGALDMLISEY